MSDSRRLRPSVRGGPRGLILLGLVVVAGGSLALVSVLLVGGLWRGLSCDTAFVLAKPVEVTVAAEAIRDSGATPHEVWFRTGETHGATYGASAEDIVGRLDGEETRFGPTQITGFRLKGLVRVESLGPLAFSTKYSLVVDRWTVLTLPYLEGDPPLRVLKTLGICGPSDPRAASRLAPYVSTVVPGAFWRD